MPLKKKIPYCLLPAFFSATVLYSQYKLQQPVYVSKENGLPTNDVRSIRKGKDGFIWMGTTEGLCRFDGQEIKTYRLGKDLRYSPADNMVNSVVLVEKEVWMGTDQGISVLNTSDQTFRHYQLDDNGKLDSISRRFQQIVQVMYMDRQGVIWAGTRERGVWMYDKQKDNFKKFDYPASAYNEVIPAAGPNTMVLSIAASNINDSIIWVGTAGALEKINKYSGEVNWYTFPQKNKEYQFALNAFRRVYEHTDGLLYVGSWETGVNIFDPVKKTFTPLPVPEGEGKEILTGSVSNIQQKNKDEMWITTSRGLVVYNSLFKTIGWSKSNQPLKYEFYGVSYIDEANRIWNVNINGVQYFDDVMQQFSQYSFEHLFNKEWAFVFYMQPESNGNSIIVCPRVTDGLYRFNKITADWIKFPFNGMKAYKNERINVRGFSEVRPGQYIISADQGLFTYYMSTGRFSPMLSAPPTSYKRWGEVLKDASGCLWIAADADGLIRWDVRKNEHRIYKKELYANKSTQGFGRILKLFEDSRNNIWFARSDGFSVHLSANDSIINFTYKQNPGNNFPVANDFAEDRTGKIWVSTTDGWYGYINVQQPEKGLVQKFDLKEKNISGHLINLATDPAGNIWGYTNKELVKIDAADHTVTSFSYSYTGKEVDFFHFSFLPTGEILLGGRNNITLVNPRELKRNSELPVPYISQIKLMNHPVDFSRYAGSQQLEFTHNQNFLTLHFSAKAFTMANDVHFRYRLSNFDDWNDAGSGRVANYTNIPPGNYIFQLQAANNEGVWNTKMLELPIHIAAAWWQTWWFRLLAVAAFAYLVYWLYRYRINQIEKKEKLKTQYEKKLANVEMTALLAQMNPHFLFNSLNSIDSYIIKNESGKASEYLNNFARLMRLILQNSRSNYISLKDELEALDLYLQMEGLRFKDKFKYEIKIGEGLDTGAVVIPPMLIQPYVENAIWHGLMHKQDGACGKVEIIIEQKENNLMCIVQDNGIGREKAQELKEQKSGTRKRSMGMQITKDRIEIINQLYNLNTSVEIIDLKTREEGPAGTRVQLIIPV